MADEDKDRRRQEVRERLAAEAAAASSKKKGGFMTPERKKRLRVLLRRKAADEVKRQLEMKEQERNRVIAERTGQRAPIEDINEEERLLQICTELHNRVYSLNESKWDLELSTALKEYEIGDLSARVNDMRGRFVIPPLKKVSKMQNQIEKMKQMNLKLAKFDMREGLRTVKKEIDLGDKGKGEHGRPAELLAALQISKTGTNLADRTGKTAPSSPTSTKAPSQIGDPVESEEEEEEDEVEEVPIVAEPEAVEA